MIGYIVQRLLAILAILVVMSMLIFGITQILPGNVAYVIAVDEFAEAQIPGLRPLTRKEFREVCNAYKTKPEILSALGRRSP